MHEEYVKDKKLLEKNEKELEDDLIKGIIKTKKELIVANKNYEYAEDELIDYYLYEIKAKQAKLDYLIKKAKKKNLILDMINEIEVNLNYEEAI